MDKKYCHLSVEERAVIMIERSKGSSLRLIARTLGRDASTVSREIRRGLPERVEGSDEAAVVGYNATTASVTYRERRRRCGRRCKLVEGTLL